MSKKTKLARLDAEFVAILHKKSLESGMSITDISRIIAKNGKIRQTEFTVRRRKKNRFELEVDSLEFF